jgi:hypothetical protein
MSQLDAASAASSPRVQQILRPAGIGDGLRLMLRANGSTWGHAGIYRELGARALHPDERAFLAAIADGIAEGLRRSLSRRPEPGAAVLVPVTREAALPKSSETQRRIKSIGPCLTKILLGLRSSCRCPTNVKQDSRRRTLIPQVGD